MLKRRHIWGMIYGHYSPFKLNHVALHRRVWGVVWGVIEYLRHRQLTLLGSEPEQICIANVRTLKSVDAIGLSSSQQ